MKLSNFKFSLSDDLIAKYPVDVRDESRLMVIDRKTNTIEHKEFKDVINYFNNEDCFILNNTKVFPARIMGKKEKTGAKIEVFLLRELDKESKLWDVIVDPARKIRIGNKIYFDDNEVLVAEVIDNTINRGRTIRFLFDGDYNEFRDTLFKFGSTPIPRYFKREAEAIDDERYQTVFADIEGSVAAPTAGLHFSKHLLKKLEIKGINFAHLTLHVGLGTFLPVEVEDLSKHKMESEKICVSQQACDIINKAKLENRKICAVGTTTVRALESSVNVNKELRPFDGWTNKFVFPPYDFAVNNAMITNFHMPKSTLLMMTAAFGGYELIMKAYKEAIDKKYRFYSYGDAMLIL